MCVPTFCSVPTGAARFSARAARANPVSCAGLWPMNSWVIQTYSGTVRRWFHSPVNAFLPVEVLASW